MTRAVWIDGDRVELTAARLVGEGGEAEVYDLGDGRVVKWWKPADHPDYDADADARAEAARRLVERPAKLRALPSLPPAVVAPSGLALAARRSAQVVGYVMARVAGVPLFAYGEPRWRRDHPTSSTDVVTALLALHDAIAALHGAGVVIGDCNDLNVLVDGCRVHLIDVDSYQLAGFPCTMFSERFVDPRLCAAAGPLAPTRPHDRDSDWFAFAAMTLRSLLGVGPWGGVDPGCPGSARAQRRRSVLGDAVVYPRAARARATLPDDALAALRAIFERDVRGVFPRDLLAGLRFLRCASCGEDHARARCPACSAPRVVATVVHGRLRHHAIAVTEVAHGAIEVERTPVRGVWLDGGALYRTTRLGPERIGSVLAQRTRAWVGRALGIGFYRAAGYAVAFTFRPDRGALDDRVALPRLRGALVAVHAALADDRAWLCFVLADAGKLVTTCVVVDADARVIASETLSADLPWLAGLGGACAVGDQLFVPTDAGIARVEVVAGAIVQTRVFAETAALVGASDRLAPHAGGLDVVRAHDVIRLELA